MQIRPFFVALFLAFIGVPVRAQRPDSGIVVVTVRESMGMVDGFLIRSEASSATSDASGRARLVLPAGRRSLVLTRIGFVPRRGLGLTTDVLQASKAPSAEWLVPPR